MILYRKRVFARHRICRGFEDSNSNFSEYRGMILHVHPEKMRFIAENPARPTLDEWFYLSTELLELSPCRMEILCIREEFFEKLEADYFVLGGHRNIDVIWTQIICEDMNWYNLTFETLSEDSVCLNKLREFWDIDFFALEVL